MWWFVRKEVLTELGDGTVGEGLTGEAQGQDLMTPGRVAHVCNPTAGGIETGGSPQALGLTSLTKMASTRFQ